LCFHIWVGEILLGKVIAALLPSIIVVGRFDFAGDGLKHPLQLAAGGKGAKSGERELKV